MFENDDNLPAMLHAAVVRIPFAQARKTNSDVSAAWEVEGVVAIYTAADLGDY